MPRKAAEKTATEVRNLNAPGLHFVGGVPGLALQVLPSGARTWVLRVMVGTKRRDIGLGGYSQNGVTLARAREAALAVRGRISKGIDPVEEARAARSQLIAAQAAALTFEQCAASYIKAQESGWRNEKHGQQYRNTLEQYVYPVMGKLHVRDVKQTHVLKVLEPIWTTKTETAVRLRGRIESVLNWAAVRGYRDADNPARWRGHLDTMLPRPEKVSKIVHHPALPIGDVGAFMVKLRAQEGMGARALEFAILTAARSGEVRGAMWEEIDLDAKVWTVPADRMKAGKEHRVPLSDEAVTLLEAQPQPHKGLVFPAPRGGKLSDMTLSAVLRRMEVPAVPHGFRSTFRDWAGDRTNYPRDLAEMALAHAVGDKVEAAYRRGDMLEKRRRMMADWAAFLSKVETKGKVVDLNAKRA